MKRAKKIVSLVPKQTSADTIKILKDLIKEAEAGDDIVSIAVACVTSWGAGVTVIGPADNAMTLAGAVARLQHRLQTDL